MKKILWPSMLAAAILVTVALHGCDKLKNETVFEDQLAESASGGIAVVDNALLITDIGLALADTSRFSLVATLEKRQGGGYRSIFADTCIVDTVADQWNCSADYELRGGMFSAALLLEFQKNFNGYPLFISPLIETDTADIQLSANDSFQVGESEEIFIDISATTFRITGFDNWITPSVAGVLVFNGSLHFNARAETGRNTPGITGDDVTFDVTYEQTFDDLAVAEGSTIPSAGTVAFVISQDVTPNPDGVPDILADFEVSGLLTFTTSGITMNINGHSYSVTVTGDGTVTITPI